ncbi:SMI1/KNR4 family protein [Neomegalonema sp.]|uniref:SMI1/KNR4 family protein n=1 Tax=Neomegalonema sp. TaxID=2039713 RepID=UPI00261134CF|nr:SMI1/KNR4 family protein [Neomegalonema sp.]MDD2868342.1 SMI1/KNR4 family protein [Neomegalonema sp.]
MDWLAELSRLMPPPSASARGPTPAAGHWAEVEAALGVGIPEDYKRFVSIWGADGLIGDFVSYYAPLSDHAALILPRAAERAIRAHGLTRAGNPQDQALPDFPAEGSFLPIGASLDGDLFGWILGPGAPETWRIAWLDAGEGAAEAQDLAFGPWLVALAKGELRGEAMSRPVFAEGRLKFVSPEE